ncbi:MAG: very short patch repair endonuclease [Spirochaetia bacterium]
MSRVKNKNTRQELIVRSLLHRLGYRFRLHRKDLPGTPDIVLPKYKTAIFVHGCFWHGHSCSRGKLPKNNREYWKAKIEKNRVRDEEACKDLREAGYYPIVIWGCEISSREKIVILGHRLERELKSG